MSVSPRLGQVRRSTKIGPPRLLRRTRVARRVSSWVVPLVPEALVGVEVWGRTGDPLDRPVRARTARVRPTPTVINGLLQVVP